MFLASRRGFLRVGLFFFTLGGEDTAAEATAGCTSRCFDPVLGNSPRRWLSAAQRALGVLPAQGVEEVDVTQQPEPQEAKDTALSGEEPEILSL